MAIRAPRAPSPAITAGAASEPMPTVASVMALCTPKTRARTLSGTTRWSRV